MAINIVAVLQSLHHIHRQTTMGVATGDVGVVKSPPTCHACFMTFDVKVTIPYVISTHKNSVIITEKTCYLKCINETLKICHYNMAVFDVQKLPGTHKIGPLLSTALLGSTHLLRKSLSFPELR